MLNKYDRTLRFKSAKEDSQLSPSYLYDIELIIQSKNWMKPDSREKPVKNACKSSQVAI